MLLAVENLNVSYGNIKALYGLNFQIDEGEIVCIIGANGAGKSTTLKAISRLVPVEDGTKMTFQGDDLLDYPADKVVSKLGISHVPEGRRLFDNLTVTENLKLATFARKDNDQIPKDVQRVFSIFPRLEERQSQKAGTLSGGEQQMLAVGRAYMSGRKVMLLDDAPFFAGTTRFSGTAIAGGVLAGLSSFMSVTCIAVNPGINDVHHLHFCIIVFKPGFHMMLFSDLGG